MSINKEDYVDKVNNNLKPPAVAKVDLTVTDITRAANAGIWLTAAIDNNATTSLLPTSGITGNDIKDLSADYGKIFGRVRRITFTLTGNVAPAGFVYTRYGRPTNTVADAGYTGPDTSNVLFNPLNAETDIDDVVYDAIISSLTTTVNAQFDTLAHAISYCHSSCHSNCHASRGRR